MAIDWRNPTPKAVGRAASDKPDASVALTLGYRLGDTFEEADGAQAIWQLTALAGVPAWVQIA